MTTRVLTTVILCVLVAGCETTFEIQREGDLSDLPDLDCARDVVERTNGFELVGHFSEPARTNDGMRHVMTYKTEVKVISLSFQEHTDGRVSFRHFAGYVNRRFIGREAELTRRAMMAVENDLTSRCEVEMLTQVEEICKGVRCPPLQPQG